MSQILITLVLRSLSTQLGGTSGGIVHGKRVHPTFGSAMSISSFTQNYKMARKRINVPMRMGWKKPLEGMIIINIDAALDINLGSDAT
jgi:hypothetical protein